MACPPKVMFTVQTMEVKDGKRLRAVHPDKNGVYHDIPMMVLDMVSRNNVHYDVQSMVDALSNPKSRFYVNLTEGNLEGEWGHPIIKDPSDLARLVVIDRARLSHYFTKMTTKQTDDNKFTVVYGDVVPYGPYGKYLEQSFQDPKRNTSFSLRALTTRPNMINGVQHKKVLSLVTIDAVDGCGYECASKRFAPESSNESLNYSHEDQEMELSIDDVVNCKEVSTLMGVESITHQQILDMLKTNEVVIHNKVIGVPCMTSKSLITTEGKRSSIFHNMFRS